MLPDDYITNDAKAKIVMDIIESTLTQAQQQTIILYYYNGLSVLEIAELMECTTGTVTSRLSMSRDKIRKAVLNYEEKNNDKLHAVMGLPFLTRFFENEARKYTVPKFSLPIQPNNTFPSDKTGNMTNASAKAGETGGKAMLNTIKGKVIAGVVAVAIVGGGITALVIHNNGDDDAVKKDNKPAVAATAKNIDNSSVLQDTSVSEMNEETIDDDEENQDVSIERQVVLDNDYVKITALEFNLCDEDLASRVNTFTLQVEIENKTDEKLIIRCIDFYLNDYKGQCSAFVETLKARETKTAEITSIKIKGMIANGINHIGKIDLYFSLKYDGVDEYTPLDEPATVITSDYDVMETEMYFFNDMTTIYDKNDIIIKAKNFDENSDWNDEAKVYYIENNTDKPLYFHEQAKTTDDKDVEVSMNSGHGFSCWIAPLQKNEKMVIAIYIDKEELEQENINLDDVLINIELSENASTSYYYQANKIDETGFIKFFE